ncbi:hypothetical protein BOTBODRAFT_113201 [Botryobasidium botryosum FD-172 SS1]|uniref:HCP-like protein n=1 Tax=Botryobasidium botryosum (strain FD-172 SS1) TaxID=930990 RepID=A0A067MKH8_BOTB1|nr:hypothetical protein BOTBODRAFT_113201 [Botryobasidium botryosum FD-172 SS1]
MAQPSERRGLPDRPHPGHAHTLPPSPASRGPPPRGNPSDGRYPADNASIHSTQSGSNSRNSANDPLQTYEQPAYYGATDPRQQVVNGYAYHPPANYHDPGPSYAQPQQIQQPYPPRGPPSQGWASPAPSLPPGGYNPYYAAASDLLGGHPGAPPPPPPTMESIPSSASAPQLYPPGAYPPNVQGGNMQGGYPPYGAPPLHHQPSMMRTHPSAPSIRSVEQYPRVQERPYDTQSIMSESGRSINGRRPMQAAEVRQPPFTKEYVDDYRARIKADPDPAVHFGFAKYLIEAAKNIGADAPDQRLVRKYRDSLISEALKIIRRLATQGETYSEAQFFLANCFGTGMLGLAVDHERAYHLYLQAAKQNHAAACYRVAVCNEIGKGTRREHPRAFAFYRKAAAMGDTAAMYKLAVIHLTGTLGQAKDGREALPWLKRAAEQADEENPHALHELGVLHEQPNSNLVVHDEAYAKDLFTKAAQLGYTASQFKLGSCYEYGNLGCPVDPKRSIAWYTKAAEKGFPDAELALSGWYLTGSEGVLMQSDAEAFLWARRSANKGLSKAEYAVGYYTEVGIGCKADLDAAKRWYMRAAAQGNKRAMNRLTELKRMGNRRVNQARPTRAQTKDECVIG